MMARLALVRGIRQFRKMPNGFDDIIWNKKRDLLTSSEMRFGNANA
jgi:hypothetical protein